MVYVYIASFVGFFASVVSMAEISSISPTSGGQYHWVSEFAAPRFQRFLSYLTGKVYDICLSRTLLINLTRVALRIGLASRLRQYLLPLRYPDPGNARFQLLR
jgi:hypothetical protein